jgi:hypothetical protein
MTSFGKSIIQNPKSKIQNPKSIYLAIRKGTIKGTIKGTMFI